GLAPDPSVFPHWLHEGLASQFEVVQGGRWAGISRANDLRLCHWSTLSIAPRIILLIKDHKFRSGYNAKKYSESWAFVYFLLKTRPGKFFAWIDLLTGPGSTKDGLTPDQKLELFQSTFGEDLSSMEEQWVRVMRTVKTEVDPGIRPSRDVGLIEG